MKNKKAKSKGKTSFFKKLILFFNIIFALCLILSYLAAYISPDTFWFIAFFGIAYPLLLLANIAFIVFWLIAKRKYALLSFIVILIGYNNLYHMVQSSRKYDASELKDAMKIISFNVRDFDIYHYRPLSKTNKNRWAYDFTNRNKIYDFLHREQPDIICFQEYVHDATRSFNTTDTLKKFLNAKHFHFDYTVNSKNMNYFGVATYTKYPILDTGRVDFTTASGNMCTYTDVKINNQRVRIYNVHFESIHLQEEDYIFAENYARSRHKAKEKEDVTIRSEKILRRLKKAFIIRAAQSRIVAEHVRKCKYPVILCGDFNDTPNSYVYHNVTSELIDSFVESGNGFGQSYAGVYPSFRIDYIMHSKDFRSYNYETVNEEMSDHYPVKCYLKFNK
jgi:endonuclease/exonuclease/phosphatase family metal-dependent hydrolase